MVGLALLTLVPFFNFHALKFNQNTVLLPLWAATTLFFLRSFESRRVIDAALAGVFAAVSIYGKYWSVMLLAGLGIAALTDARSRAYFRSPAPWVTVAAGVVVLAPHVLWLSGNGFAPFSYALATHSAPSFAAVALSTSHLLGRRDGLCGVAGDPRACRDAAEPSGGRPACYGPKHPSDGWRRFRSGRRCWCRSQSLSWRSFR